MESLVGRTLQNGKYLIDRELGQGGFGITYKAIDLASNKPMVIKTLKQGSLDDRHREKIRNQFIDEARRLCQCEHTNIVRYDHFFEEQEQPFIVMDYIPGSTLDEIVIPDEKPLEEATAIRYIQQVAEALKVVHGNGLLHRDIKPQNIMLNRETQQVVLIDFGISREFSQGKTSTHTNLISEGYAPIEQYLPKAKRTAATDVYGLAATLYTLLTAQIPTAPTLRDRIPLQSPKELNSNISYGVSQAVMKGMELEAKQRPPTVDAWLNLLLNSKERNIIIPANYDRPRSAQKEVRGNLPETAKEGSFASFSLRRRIFLPIKTLAFVSALVLGVGYAGSKLGSISLQDKIPTVQEKIDKQKDPQKLDSDLKNLKSQPEVRQAIPEKKVNRKPQADPPAPEIATTPKITAPKREPQTTANPQPAEPKAIKIEEPSRDFKLHQQAAVKTLTREQIQQQQQAAARKRAADHQKQLTIQAKQAPLRQRFDREDEDYEDEDYNSSNRFDREDEDYEDED